eukprot:533746_1
MPFEKKYQFKKTNTVVIKHNEGKFLRVKPGDLDNLGPEGGKGQFAQWEIDPQNNGNKCRIKSKKTGKYLRINNDGNIDVKGSGGKWTVFKVKSYGAVNEVKLESDETNGKYIAVGKNGNIKVGGGGPHCKLQIFRD